jgi:hypothetical protein
MGVKRPGREADHSPPSSAEVKNAWHYTSTTPIRLHSVVLSPKKKKKAQGQLHLQLLLSAPLCVLYVPPISSSLIWSSQ